MMCFLCHSPTPVDSLGAWRVQNSTTCQIWFPPPPRPHCDCRYSDSLPVPTEQDHRALSGGHLWPVSGLCICARASLRQWETVLNTCNQRDHMVNIT